MAVLSIVCSGAMEGLDGQPVVQPRYPGCSRTYEVTVERGDPGDPDTWDVRTDEYGNVVRRSKQTTCPACGIGTFVVEEDPS